MFIQADKAHLFLNIPRVNCQELSKRFHFFRGVPIVMGKTERSDPGAKLGAKSGANAAEAETDSIGRQSIG